MDKHFEFSLIKSFFRIGAGIMLIYGNLEGYLIGAGVLLIIAELFGIFEEL